MKRPRSVKDAGSYVIAGACAYECVAIVSGAVPTWTVLTRSLSPRARAFAVGAFISWFVVHMMAPEESRWHRVM